MANNFEEVLRLVVKTEGGSEVGKLAASVLELGKAGDVSEEQLQGLAEEVARLAEAQKAVKSITALKAALQETGDKLFLAKRGLADLNAQFDKTDTSNGKITAAFREAEKAVSDLSVQERVLQLQLEKSNGIVAKHGLDVNKLAEADQKLAAQAQTAAQSLQGFAAQTDSAASGTSRLERVTQAVGKGFDAARSGLNSFASGLLRITGIAGGVSAALATLNVGRFFKGAVESATSFEAALSQVRAVSGATADELLQMRDAAENASETTKFTALQAADALGELARASGDSQSAIALLPPTLNLAQASGIGASEAAGLLTTTITQFGLATEDATRVADLFAREANSTQDTVTDLGNALSYAAPLARQLGVSVEDTTAILGALADQGFRGERAGTALRNTFADLIDPASKFRAELNTLGIKGNDFNEIIVKLAAAGKQGEAALLALGDRGGPAITSLVNTGGAGIRRLTEDFKNAAGEAQRTAKIMGENFAGASSRLANAFDAMRRSLVEPILEPLGRQFDAVAIKVRAFLETAQFERINQAIQDFALGATDALIKFVGSIDFNAVANSIKGFADSANSFFASIKESATTVGTALSIVGGTIKTLFNGIQTIVLGVAAASTAGLALMLKSATLTAEGIARLSGNYEQLKPIFDSVNEKIGGITAVSAEFARRAVENGKETKDAFVGLAGALDDTKASSDSFGTSVDDTGKKIKLTAEQVVEAKRQFDALPPSVQAMVEPGLRAAGVFSTIAEESAKAEQEQAKFADALAKAKAAAASAYNELSKLSGAGDTTSAAYLKAKAALAAANAEVARLSGTSREAAAAATELAAAQGRLGNTQAQLSATADQAAADLDILYQQFKSGSGAIEDVRASFDKYATALRASVANSDQWRKDQVENILAVKSAALGIGEIKGPDFKAGNTKPLSDGLQQVRQQSTQAAEGLNEVDKQAGETAQGVGSAAQAIQNIYAGFANQLGQTSQAAIEQFTKLTREIFELSAGIADFSGLARFGKAAQDAYDIISGRIENQKAGVASLAGQYANLSDEAVRAMINTRGGVDDVAAGLSAMADEARNGRSEFDLLGAQDLSALASALDSAAAKTRQIADEARAAKEQLRGIADSLQDELDRAAGRNADIENRRYQQQLDDIKRLAEASGNLNSAEYNDAISRAKQLHDLNLRNIAEEKKAREAAKKSTDSNDSGSSGGGSSGSGGSAPSPSPTPQPKPGSQSSRTGSGNSYSLTFNITGNSSDVAREVKKQLDEIARRSR